MHFTSSHFDDTRDSTETGCVLFAREYEEAVRDAGKLTDDRAVALDYGSQLPMLSRQRVESSPRAEGAFPGAGLEPNVGGAWPFEADLPEHERTLGAHAEWGNEGPRGLVVSGLLGAADPAQQTQRADDRMGTHSADEHRRERRETPVPPRETRVTNPTPRRSV